MAPEQGGAPLQRPSHGEEEGDEDDHDRMNELDSHAQRYTEEWSAENGRGASKGDTTGDGEGSRSVASPAAAAEASRPSRRIERDSGHDTGAPRATDLRLLYQQEHRRRVAAEVRLAALQALAHQHKDEADRHRKGHAQMLRDLNRFKASQGFSQLPDDYLAQHAAGLRQDIRDFAAQYFLGEVDGDGDGDGDVAFEGTDLSPFAAYWKSVSPLDPGRALLRSPARAASAVEAFVWVVLAQAVFGRWFWAGEARSALVRLCACMRARDSDGHGVALLDPPPRDAVDLDAERKFYAWRATTARLVSERPDDGTGAGDIRSALVDGIANELAPFLRQRSGGHREDMGAIVDKAVAFDRATSQQPARLEWVFCHLPGQPAPVRPHRFDPVRMELQQYEDLPGPDSHVFLVVAPGLRKRGKSNGEDYGSETMLLKMEVSCDPLVD